MKEYKYNLENLDANLYKCILDNGLEVYLLPYENKNTYYMHYITKFGSIDTEFVPIGEKEMTKVPDGIAHFLEHKMFEVKEGPTPFEFSSANGTYCNAFTGYESTRYLFEGNDNFKETLDYLLTYVNTPYFTDENVEKEKGIIKEELLQYKDIPDFEIYKILLENILIKDNHRIDVGGTVDSIMDINKEDLYKTYNTFYHPSNMILIITGNFKKEDAIDVLKNNKYLNQKRQAFKVIKKNIIEPLEINVKYKDIKMDIQSTRVTYSIKIPISKYKGIERYKYFLNLSTILSINFGITSDFREKINKKELVTSFYYDKVSLGDYLIIDFVALSEQPEELLKELKDVFNNIIVTEEDVKRIKKVWISDEVLRIDDADATLDNIAYQLLEFGNIIPNKINYIKSINLDDINESLKTIDFNNSSTLIVRPLKKLNKC